MTHLKAIPFFLLLVSLISFTACDSSSEADDPCPKVADDDLQLTIQEEYTTLPAKVSVFFKVDDKDGMPVANLNSASFTIYEKGRNDDCERSISSFESNAVVSSRKQIFAYNTVLILDLSASVTATSLDELKLAAKDFIAEVMPNDDNENYAMGIWWFDGQDELHELIAPSSDPAALQNAIDGISPAISDDPSTDLYGAVIKGVAEAEALQNSFEAEDIISAVSIVIFTDGTDQAGRYLKTDAMDAVNTANNAVRFFSIGLGGEIDEEVLTEIGKHGSVFAADQTELENTFQQVAQIVWAEANSYYLFEYCSPKRDGSGTNELRIVVNTNEGVSGSVVTEFDATGFGSGCQ